MAVTLRNQAQGILSAIGTYIISASNWPQEPTTALGIILGYTTTGTPATLSITFEGSQNGTSGWTAIGAAQTNTTSGSVTLPQASVYPYVRANLTALTGGTAPTLILYSTTQNGN